MEEIYPVGNQYFSEYVIDSFTKSVAFVSLGYNVI